jgi:hypothetical protein
MGCIARNQPRMQRNAFGTLWHALTRPGCRETLAGGGAQAATPEASQRLAGGRAPVADPEAVPEICRWSSAARLEGRTRFYSDADRVVIKTIRCGILFVMAFWSGPAQLAFAELKRALEKVDTGGRLELVVIDTDGCPDLYETPEFAGTLAGAGETAWVRDGQVLWTSGRGYHPEFLSRTRGGCYSSFS